MRKFVSIALFALLAACASTGQPSSTEVDPAVVQAELLEADRAWAEAYASSDDPVAAFLNSIAEQAYLLPPDAPLAQGKDAMAEVVTQLEATPGFSITWGPKVARVSRLGDLGFTIGAYEMKMAPDGTPVRIDGKYLTVWEKQPDGSWKVIADMFNADGPPTPVEE